MPLTEAEKIIRAEKASALENRFFTLWKQASDHAIMPSRQVFFSDQRDFRFDFAWIDYMVALEVQGGTWVRGAHTTGTGQTRDAYKNNLAVTLGWKLFYCTSDMLTIHPDWLVESIQSMLLTKSHSKQQMMCYVRSLQIGDQYQWKSLTARRSGQNDFVVFDDESSELVTSKQLKTSQRKVLDILWNV